MASENQSGDAGRGPVADTEKGRRLARRRMAGFAFTFLLLQGLIVTLAILLLDDRAAIAQALTVAWPILGGVQVAMVSIVLGYLGVSLTEQLMRPK